MAAMKPRSSASRTSSGRTSSRMNPRIHSSLASNSGSVEKSQVMAASYSRGPRELTASRSVARCADGVAGPRSSWGSNAFIEQGDALVDHAHDGSPQPFVHGVGPLAAAVQHGVVAQDGRVLVQAHRRVPALLLGVGAVHAHELVDADVDRAA